MKQIDLTGKKINKWTVISKTDRNSYWNCKCECGREVIVNGGNLRKGLSKGCLSCGQIRLPIGESGLNRVFHEYEIGAKKRGYKFSLTKDEVKNLIISGCSYCGKLPDEEPVSQKTVGKFVKPFYFNGIDRLNNKEGYIEGNVVTSCFVCNRAKRELPLEVFNLWISRLKKNLT